MKLNPAVRTGLIYAGVHQAFALCGLAIFWVDLRLGVFSGLALSLADFPVLFVAGALGLSPWQPTPQNPLSGIPGTLSIFAVIAEMLILGAAQWFLIGCAVSAWRCKREQKQQRCGSWSSEL
jgi:hypothetical protein